MEFQTFTLSNGIRVIHKQDTTTNVSHCGLIINVGSRDEDEHEQGVAHYIEHSFFKGTQKRKAFHILSRLAAVGGELNAYTTKEETCIYASFLKEHYERSVELISDIVFNSTYPAKEIEKEKAVIIDEIDSYLDSPSEQIFDDFEDLVFANHSLGKNILGTKESVQSFKQQHIKDFIKKNYATDKMVFSSIGNTAYYEKHKNKGTLYLLNNLLGGPEMNTRLNLSIREKYGYTYNLESNYQPYSDTGIFSIYMGTDSKYLNKTISLVEKELKKLRETKLGIRQLKEAKQQLIGYATLAEEGKCNKMLSVGKTLLNFNKIEDMDSIYKKLNAITAEQILEVANQIFEPSKLSYLVYRSEG